MVLDPLTSMLSAFLVVCVSFTTLSATKDILQITLVLGQEKTQLFKVQIFWGAVMYRNIESKSNANLRYRSSYDALNLP